MASLVKDGKTSKEIANYLNVAETTVNFHRKNLRKKFDLTQPSWQFSGHICCRLLKGRGKK